MRFEIYFFPWNPCQVSTRSIKGPATGRIPKRRRRRRDEHARQHGFCAGRRCRRHTWRRPVPPRRPRGDGVRGRAPPQRHPWPDHGGKQLTKLAVQTCTAPLFHSLVQRVVEESFVVRRVSFASPSWLACELMDWPSRMCRLVGAVCGHQLPLTAGLVFVSLTKHDNTLHRFLINELNLHVKLRKRYTLIDPYLVDTSG